MSLKSHENLTSYCKNFWDREKRKMAISADVKGRTKLFLFENDLLQDVRADLALKTRTGFPVGLWALG